MQTHIKPVPSSTGNHFEKAMAANDAAVARFNALPKSLENDDPAAFAQEEDRLLEGLRLADRAVPTSWSELERWVTHITNDGKADVDRDNAVRLLAHVRRLLEPVTRSADWDAAMQEYERVRATPYDGDKDGDEHPHTVTVDRLLNMPAPHGDALAWKIDHLFQPEGNGFIGCYAYSFVKPTLADAVRLAGGTPLGPLA